jgi:hypothetical protein
MFDITGFLTSTDFLAQLAAFITALVTGILQMFIAGTTSF